jgi:class 3 adenylate cyclase
MDFYEVLEQVLVLLQQHGRVSYRALKRQFDLDDDYIDDLKAELIQARRVAVDEDGSVLVWRGDAQPIPEPTLTAQPSVTEAAPPSPAKSPPSPHTPDAERRQLTVMFCDLTDSTKLSGQLDPEDLRDVIRAYQSTSAEVIERFDGYVAQHLGDGLMVYFGWPQAHEDDARRAVHAGLGIIKAMSGPNVRWQQEKDIRLAVRIGIHTGLVVVGKIGQGASQEHLALRTATSLAHL